jgi:hypothetical protein
MPRASSTAKAAAAADDQVVAEAPNEAPTSTSLPSTTKRKRRATAVAATITTVLAATSVEVQVDGATAVSVAKKTKRVVKSKKIAVAEPPSEGLLLRAKLIKEVLDQLFPDPPMPLDHCNNFTLLAAVLLSAQTTDGKVSMITSKNMRSTV